MPDLDIVERRIPKHWRPPYKLMKGGHPVEAVADSVVKAMAAQLRADGGAPGFPEFVDALYPSGPRISPEERSVAAVARKIERRFEQRVSVKELSRAFQRHQARVAASRALPSAMHLAKEHCWELARHHLFGRVEPTLIGRGLRFENPDTLIDFELRVRAEADSQLEQLGRKIVADPANDRLRAPARVHRRRSTAELLDETIPSWGPHR